MDKFSINKNNSKCIIFNKSSEKMEEISDSSIDLVFTSPPYANLREDGIDPDNYVDWFKPFAKEIKRVLTENGNFILNINEIINKGVVHPYIDDLKKFLRDIELNQIAKPYIWYKKTVIPSNCKYRAIDRYEYCFWFSKNKGTFYREHVRKPYADISIKRVDYRVMSLSARGEKDSKKYTRSKVHPDGALPHNVLEICPECKSDNKHHSPFPLELARWFILAGSKSGDFVLDPFMGSGTTAIESLKNERNVFGYEKLKEHFDFSGERIKKNFESKKIF